MSKQTIIILSVVAIVAIVAIYLKSKPAVATAPASTANPIVSFFKSLGA